MNNGVAFGLPLPIVLVSALTVPLVGVMVWLMIRAYRRDTREALFQAMGLLSIITGALSNLIDRVLYHETVDYFLIFTGVINVADIMIILGFIILFFTLRDKRDAPTGE